MSVLEAAWEGASYVFSWPNILYPVLGTLVAMLFSAVPGLSGVTLMALAIPLTLRWEPVPLFLLYGAFTGGATFMGSVTAILFGVPGRNSNAATVLDGYPLAQQGKATTAIACSATASALGSTFGVVVLLVSIPFLIDLTLAFGPAEILMMTIWGLTMVAASWAPSRSSGSGLQGYALAGLGLLLSFVGYDGRTAELRYTFGSAYLREGVGQIPIFLGIFAIAAVVELVAQDRPTISGRTRVEELGGSVAEGVRSVFGNFGLFLRSSTIGAVVGAIPGIGATVASLVAYAHAASSARGETTAFGDGNLRGVLAPEAANDAKDGTSLIPTFAFGIPGGSATAVLLGVLAMHGMRPGRDLLTTGLPLVFAFVWSLFLSNWLTSLIGLATVAPLTRLTTVRTQLVVPVILTMASVGAYVHRSRIEDVVVAYVFGGLGYLLKKFGWPRVPFVVGLVLGPIFESNLHLTLRLQELGRIQFWSRPIAMILLALTILGLVVPATMRRRGRVRDGAT